MGESSFSGKAWESSPPASSPARSGNVFQNPTDQFFTRKAADEVALVGENLGMPREELIERVESAFESMKIAHLAGKDLIGLSGGEKQRVAIASTLVYDTQVIFFDEPSASLDHEGDRGLSPNPRRFEGSRQDRRHRRAQALLSGGSLRQAPRHGGRQIVDSFAAGRLRAEVARAMGLRALV